MLGKLIVPTVMVASASLVWLHYKVWEATRYVVYAPQMSSGIRTIKSTAISALSILPAGIRNALFHLSFNIARPEFEIFSHLYAHAPNMELGLAALARRGLQPKTILDVGAFEGDWSAMARSIWPKSKIIMFEPNAAKAVIVSKAASIIKAELIRELLGATDGAEVIFNVMESGSSIMNENSPLERVQEKRTLKRLDSLVGSLEPGAFLKIDAQGYELEILKGSERIMPSIEAVLLEVSLIEINKGAPLLADVTAFMKERGFVVCEILEIHRRPLDRALCQVDFLFVRENSFLMTDTRHYA
jgi:FkbM family methyltransferase